MSNKLTAEQVMEALCLYATPVQFGLESAQGVADVLNAKLYGGYASLRGDGKQQEWCDICNAPKVPFCKTHAARQARQPLTLRIMSLTDTHGTTFTAVCEAAWEAIDREGRTIVLTLHEAVCAKCGESMRVGHQCQASQPIHSSGEQGQDDGLDYNCPVHGLESNCKCPQSGYARVLAERTAFQRGQRAMAEKAAQAVHYWPHTVDARDKLVDRVRSLAGAEPQPTCTNCNKPMSDAIRLCSRCWNDAANRITVADAQITDLQRRTVEPPQDKLAGLEDELIDIVNGELGDWGGPERAVLNGRAKEIIKQIRALLAAREPGASERK